LVQRLKSGLAHGLADLLYENSVVNGHGATQIWTTDLAIAA
jgi:hypothetical protein